MWYDLKTYGALCWQKGFKNIVRKYIQLDFTLVKYTKNTEAIQIIN